MPASVFLQVVDLTAIVAKSPRTLIVLKKEHNYEGGFDFIPSLPIDATNSVTMTRSNAELRLNGNIVQLDSLKRSLWRLAKHDRSSPIVICPGTTDSVQDLVDLIDECHQVGLCEIHIVKEAPVVRSVNEDAQQSAAPLHRDPQAGHSDGER